MYIYIYICVKHMEITIITNHCLKWGSSDNQSLYNHNQFPPRGLPNSGGDWSYLFAQSSNLQLFLRVVIQTTFRSDCFLCSTSNLSFTA